MTTVWSCIHDSLIVNPMLYIFSALFLAISRHVSNDVDTCFLGERPFVCMECGHAFNQKNALETHMRKHRGDRPHKCPFCMRACTQKGNLNTHIRRAHRTELQSQAEHSSSASDSANQTFALLSVNKEHSSVDKTGKVVDDMSFL